MEKLPNKLLITVSGPSGCGKNSLIKALHKLDSKICHFVTATTRSPRVGEENGSTYFFLSEEEFTQKLDAENFLEHNGAYHGHRYGTLRSVVVKLMQQGNDIISDINWTGVAQFKEKASENVLSFAILPPSLEELNRRLTNRARKSLETEEARDARISQFKYDLKHMDNPEYIFTNPDMVGSKIGDYSHIIVNDVLQDAAEEMYSYICAAREKMAG